MPYRRTIWKLNEEYAPPPEKADDVDLQRVGLIQSIEAAKKRTPPIPIARLPELAEKPKAPPNVGELDPKAFAAYLSDLCVYGVGIKTAVCLLAVTSGGQFPPMDEKLAAGLLKLGFIDGEDGNALNSPNIETFTSVYVRKVVPRWRKARSKGEPPEDIDRRWARGRHET